MEDHAAAWAKFLAEQTPGPAPPATRRRGPEDMTPTRMLSGLGLEEPSSEPVTTPLGPPLGLTPGAMIMRPARARRPWPDPPQAAHDAAQPQRVLGARRARHAGIERVDLTPLAGPPSLRLGRIERVGASVHARRLSAQGAAPERPGRSGAPELLDAMRQASWVESLAIERLVQLIPAGHYMLLAKGVIHEGLDAAEIALLLCRGLLWSADLMCHERGQWSDVHRHESLRLVRTQLSSSLSVMLEGMGR